MLKLRLKRVGRRHDPSFRVVVTENTAPPKGKYLEAVGFYNARLKQIKLDAERIRHWLSVGAQPTDTVHNLLIKEGVVEGAKIAVHSTKVRKKEDEVVAEKIPTEEAPTEESPKAEETAAGDGAEKKEEVPEAPKEDKEGEKKDTTEEVAKKEDKEETPTDSTQDAPQEKEEEKPAEAASDAAEAEEVTPTKSDENDGKDKEDVKESAPAKETKEEN